MSETTSVLDKAPTSSSGDGNSDIAVKPVFGEKPKDDMLATISPTGETTYNNDALAKLKAKVDMGEKPEAVLNTLGTLSEYQTETTKDRTPLVKKQSWPKRVASIMLLASKLLGRGGGDAVAPHDFTQDIAQNTKPATTISGEMPSQQTSFERTPDQTPQQEPQNKTTPDIAPVPDVTPTPNPDISENPTPETNPEPDSPRSGEDNPPEGNDQPRKLTDMTKSEEHPTVSAPPVIEQKQPTAMPGTGGGGMAGNYDPTVSAETLNQELRDRAATQDK